MLEKNALRFFQTKVVENFSRDGSHSQRWAPDQSREPQMVCSCIIQIVSCFHDYFQLFFVLIVDFIPYCFYVVQCLFLYIQDGCSLSLMQKIIYLDCCFNTINVQTIQINTLHFFVIVSPVVVLVSPRGVYITSLLVVHQVSNFLFASYFRYVLKMKERKTLHVLLVCEL